MFPIRIRTALGLATPLLVSGVLARGDNSPQPTRSSMDAKSQHVVARGQQPTSDIVGSPQLRATDAQMWAQHFAAIQLEVLKQRQAERDMTVREMSNLQARHHELMMQIIANIKPSGRYEYNPATGRYDRYVPNP